MKTLLKCLATHAALLAACALVPVRSMAADDTDDVRASLEILRSDVNGAKIATLNQVMQLTGPEADRFWPVYRKYEKELAAVGDRKLALIREFGAAHFGGALDDRKAADLAARWLKNNQERLNLWKKYHKRISRAVSPIRAAQFLQIEHQLSLFIDLSIASGMPAVSSPKSK
jgi:hypothetical protein